MIANGNYLIKFLSGTDKRYVIPVYQRPYSWKKENCKLLLTDLKSTHLKKADSHFFGGIVYVATEIAGCTEHIIIDGQQRIITVSILLLAIRNYIQKNNYEINIEPKKITNAYLIDEYANNEKKLKLVKGDELAYDNLIDDLKHIDDNAITVNYNYFYSKIEMMSIEELKGVYDSILKLMIVQISLEPTKGDDPQLIFESLNSTGKDLEESDKIRNYILMNMTVEEQERIYTKYWNVLESTVSRKDLEKFIRYYLAAKNFELANKNRLYFEFKHYVIDKKIETEEVLKDMIQYAEWFNLIKNTKNNSVGYKQTLNRIIKLGVDSCIPLIFVLLEAFYNSELTERELEKVLCVTESYIARRYICGLAANQLNKVFVGIGLEVKKYVSKDNVSYYDAFIYAILVKSGKSRFPNEYEFADRFTLFELYNAKPTIRKYFLESLENANTKEKIAVEEQIDAGTLTIEHIMPQKLTRDWKKLLGKNWESTHTRYKDTIGNLTLTAYNSDYSNFSFKKKKEMPDKGFNSSKLYLNDYIKNCDEWCENNIIYRAELLHNIAKDIWYMPETEYSAQEGENWIDWDDEDFNFTGKIISKFRFFGEEIQTSTISDAYLKINRELYEIDTTRYLSKENKYIRNSKDMFIRAEMIVANVFIEGNASSQDKINNISYIANLIGLESNNIQYLIKGVVIKEFDINNEDTFSSIKIGDLAFRLFSDLVKNNMLSNEEVEKLKDKEISKEIFKTTGYPVLANDRNAHKGKSDIIRYKKEPLVIQGIKVYISTQWFERNREPLIDWYINHRK